MTIVRFFFATLTILISFNTFALTEADCRTRVNNAMHNSDKLGGNDADAYRWAQNAANECYKEIAQNKSSYKSSSDTSSSGGGSIFVSLLLLGGVAYLIFRPRLASENEVRSAYKKLASLYKENSSDHPAIRQYKKDSLAGLESGLKDTLQMIKEQNEFLTQYLVKEMVSEAYADLNKRELEVKNNGKIKIEIARKVCLSCRKINDKSATICLSCKKTLRSEEEIIANLEKHEEKKINDHILLNEQEDALKIGLPQFGLLIEKRAFSLGEGYIGRVCYAYLSGKLTWSTPFGIPSNHFFQNSERENIYALSPTDQLYEDVSFPINQHRAKEIALESLKKIVHETSSSKNKNNLWDHKVKKIYAWMELFWADSYERKEIELSSFSPLYKHLYDTDTELFKATQQSVAMWEIERHIKYDKNLYTSVNEYLNKKVPFFEFLSDEFIKECELYWVALVEEKRLRKEKRLEKKKK